MYIKQLFFIFIIIISQSLAVADMCDRLVSCMSINGDHAIKDFKFKLRMAEVPFLIEEDSLFTHFIWSKKYDPVVNIVKEKSYEENVLGKAKLYMDIGKSKKGIDLIKQEAEKGNSDAYILLGMEYRRGRFVPKNLEKAFSYYSLAKEAGNADGFFYLGRCYEMGIGVQKNCKKAIELFEEGVKRNNRMSMYRLSEYYKIGACGLQKNIEKAKILTQKMKKSGEHPARP
jgi:TPR repeat protein